METRRATLIFMKKGLFLVFAFVALPVLAFALPNDYNPASVGAGKPEVHIKTDGTMTVRSAKVDQILNTTLFLTTKWGTMPLRWTMKTDASTKVVKRYGGSARVSDIKLGDYLDVEGDFFVGSDFFGLTAQSIKDWSLQEEAGTFSGRIVEYNANNFVLQTPAQNITVQPATSTSIKKGGVAISWSRLKNGDTVVLADGVYDYVKNTLTATQIVVFQPTAAFAARNYEGTLKRIDAPRLPTTLAVTAGGTPYTVLLSEKTVVLKKGRAPAELSRFVAGDTVRFYGSLRPEENILRDELVVDAEVVRNLNL